jgi:hypothetical protein
MVTHSAAGVLFVVVFGVAGCASSEGTSDDNPESTLSEESAYKTGVGAKLGGEYVSKSRLYPTLSLNAKDQTYKWDNGLRCIRMPCPSGEAGKWKIYKGFGGHYYAHLLSAAKESHWFRVRLTKASVVTELDGVWGETTDFVPRANANQ